jgi:hypothetical protein
LAPLYVCGIMHVLIVMVFIIVIFCGFAFLIRKFTLILVYQLIKMNKCSVIVCGQINTIFCKHKYLCWILSFLIFYVCQKKLIIQFKLLFIAV